MTAFHATHSPLIASSQWRSTTCENTMLDTQCPDTAADLAAICALESRRCDLISQGDIRGLAELMTDDYVHVHATGRVDDKTAALKSFESMPRRCSRGELVVRLMGDVAVVVGPQVNIMPRGDDVPQESTLTVTTVLRREDDGWRMASFHGCRQA